MLRSILVGFITTFICYLWLDINFDIRPEVCYVFAIFISVLFYFIVKIYISISIENKVLNTEEDLIDDSLNQDDDGEITICREYFDNEEPILMKQKRKDLITDLDILTL